MAKKNVPIVFVNEVQNSISTELEFNPVYSLEPDPSGGLGLDEEQKRFIKEYINYRSIGYAAEQTGIEEEVAKSYYLNPQIKAEIRRINLAMYQRKFNRRLLNIDEIGGYLTSMLIDEDVAEVDKLSSKDKLKVVEMIMNLNKTKQEVLNNPTINNVIDYTNTEQEIKNLDTKDLKRLIEEIKNPSQETIDKKKQERDIKKDLIKQINIEGLMDPSELAVLETQSIEELQKLLSYQKNEKPKN